MVFLFSAHPPIVPSITQTHSRPFTLEQTGLGHMLREPKAWVQILAQPQTHHVPLGQGLSLPSLVCKMGLIEPASHRVTEGSQCHNTWPGPAWVAPGASSPEREWLRVLGEPEKNSYLLTGKTTFSKTLEAKQPNEATSGPLGEPGPWTTGSMLNPQQQPSQGVKRLRRASPHEADWGHQAPHITAPGHLSLTPGPGTLNLLSPFLVSGWSPHRSASSISSLLFITRLRTVPGSVGSMNDQAKQGGDELPGEGGPGRSDFQRVPAWRGVPECHRCHHAAVLAPQRHELSIR